jgi:hypothetical protein
MAWFTLRSARRLLILAAILLVLPCQASEHPGNIFIAGETVRIPIPTSWTGWRALDVDHQEVAHGQPTAGAADLGALPIGYYELREQHGPGRITAGVVAKSSPAEDTPIALDAAMAWFYQNPEQIRDACTLCRLAGVKWVRDRLSWPELEPERGKWAGETRYERALRLQHDAGLKVLQVNHASPPWASPNAAHFPDDLRPVYDFYKQLAQRWHGLVDALEPWNEPDIEVFGGHTGCEIASFQKAAFLALKAGDPQLTVCESVFAIDRPETLDEFGANEVFPYFDRYDLHHYIALPAYPRAYGRHRAVSGGRPMWTTEFNLTVDWADEKTKEPSDEMLHRQAYRVAKVFSQALHEGTQKAFYFILGDYVERHLQYGLIHQDMTPRPAFVAFAAVGRLLSGAQPLGRVKLGDDKLKAYLFRTQIDGAPRETLVAWSETKPTAVSVMHVEKAFDYLGRELPAAEKFQLAAPPVFLVLPPGGSRELSIEPPPAKPAFRAGQPVPVVLQLLAKTDFKRSAFVLDESRQLRLAAYNFGDKPVQGTLKLTGATAEKSDLQLQPGLRQELTLTADDSAQVTAQLDLPGGHRAIVSGNVIAADSAAKTK